MKFSLCSGVNVSNDKLIKKTYQNKKEVKLYFIHK